MLTGVSLICAPVCALVLAPTAAWAAEPEWSNLDARRYDAPIPRAGTLIAAVPLDPALSVAGAERAYRILYSTVDQHDSPAVSTAAVFVPRGQAPEGGWPVIAWAHGTVGLGDDCAPSAQPRSARDNEYLTHWLDQGYAVVGSDYAGLGTPGLMSYLNSVATAHSVVDSVIAMHEMDLPLSPEWAIVGQSQGGGAAVNSARWATEFSRGTGLDYRGVVATGTPFNVESIVKQAGPDMALPPNLGPAANSYTGYILAGFREARPDIDVDSVLTPAGLDAVAKAETLCKPQLDAALAGMTPTDFFRAPLATLPGVDAALDAYMGTPTSGYDRPIFLGVGMQDRDVPPNLTLQLDEALRANGQDVTLKVYPDEDHSGTVLASVPDSTPFLRAAFDRG
ncbi:alpha/beta hydrolase family protein [Mycolicibacterium smegmatis]|uniref:alpha/beta hydrolase family protein n=1 Tax=Mycolicibacterium smegmatis TaxID=1772 RepID=UPI0009BF9132|nr:prolyl oligopeptidase family serine peptidase [Mycolicibacterium smegmatis]MDF1898711.1 prolyl oligopeptidase family serine peptidase [Mycolicibacterium smegmatis]MDF1906025.1 prolyl oligopeptidase family serine peptidase [Mycolicibacterium smegmatis]MDF1917322.1 prolyl oligopeptidase family serine peptidase [Mycolicibacterium smegmatis]MDF1924862.1 prolyl oligopeptidase family serine peptidase [Mycolicibacterium smegmatis]UAK58692.1 S9 family peptidase [Mycolicibacterium smegmatis]